MAILKAPSKRPQNTTLHIRVGETVRHNLDTYAEFIEANLFYVASQVLSLLFRKDIAFKHWSGRHIHSFIPGQLEGDTLTKTS